MKPIDCIIVLANEMDKNGVLNTISEERIKLASETFFKHPLATMITCGWNYRNDSNIFLGEALKNHAVNLGVPAEKIMCELNTKDTVGEAFFTKLNIVKNNGWKNILVVTSDYHAERALKIFKFIYGDQYHIDSIGASGSDNKEKQAAEVKSTATFKQTFGDLKPGDDVKISERLVTQHPFYNGEIYPTINLQDRILFLGSSESEVCNWLVKNGENVFATVDKISKAFVQTNKFDSIIQNKL